jgi:hypothetical protein
LGLHVDVYQRELTQLGTGRTASAIQVSGTWELDPGWLLGAGLGVARSSPSTEGESVTGLLSVASPQRYPATATAMISRSSLDATASLAGRGVVVNAIDASVRWTPQPRWSVRAGLGRGAFRGTTDNARTSASIAGSRRVGGSWTLGGSVRYFGFDHDAQDGYFDPESFKLVELTVRWATQWGHWSLLVEGAPGSQWINDTSASATVRASGKLTYRVAPGQEVFIGAGGSSAGLQSFAAGTGYRYGAAVVGTSWVF